MASMRLLCDLLGRDRRRVQPSSEPLLYEFENCAPIFENRFQPCEAPHLRKINSPETEACDKDVDAITQRLVVQQIHRLVDCLRTVRVDPPNAYLVELQPRSRANQRVSAKRNCWQAFLCLLSNGRRSGRQAREGIENSGRRDMLRVRGLADTEGWLAILGPRCDYAGSRRAGQLARVCASYS